MACGSCGHKYPGTRGVAPKRSTAMPIGRYQVRPVGRVIKPRASINDVLNSSPDAKNVGGAVAPPTSKSEE